MSELAAITASLREAHAQFATAVESIRPALHRYCARMTGSVLDGEDLVQETLAQACYRLTLNREEVELRPWLFTIAHHRCVDFLRRRSVVPMVELQDGDEPTAESDVALEDRELASHEFSRLVSVLPPRERAAVVLKDVLDSSLPEIAQILETSVGGVKAALHRGRARLAASTDAPPTRRPPTPALMSQYVAAFNRRDWTGLQALLAHEVQCELVGFVHLAGRDATTNSYLATYGRLSYTWRLAFGTIDGEPAVIVLREDAGTWTPRHAIRLTWNGERVTRIRDYAHVPRLFDAAHVTVDAPEPAP